ncbi:MAG: hypothetical protein LBL66_04655 [Clostridiales bacterium]|nr:hypothetical protein [Clostridiales bacterium]
MTIVAGFGAGCGIAGSISGKIKISRDMFENYVAPITDAVSVGIAKSDKNSADADDAKQTSKSFFVTFDENGDIERVVFRAKKQNGEEQTISQENINGEIDKMYVSGEFVFIRYSKFVSSGGGDPRDIDPDYDKKDYACDSDRQSFAVHKSTGKVYSLSALNASVLNIEDGNIVLVCTEQTNTSLLNTYYSLSVSDGNLVFTDIVPNKNIYISKVHVDKFGHVFVKNDKSTEVIGDYIYYISDNVVKGSDGFTYEYTDNLWAYTLNYYNANKQLVKVPNDRKVYLEKGYYGNLMVAGRYIFTLDYFLHVSYDDGDGLYKSWGSLYPTYSNSLVVSNELFLLAENQDSSLALIYYNLSSINTPPTDYVWYVGSPYLSDVRPVLTVSSARVQNDVIYAVVESVMGQKTYAVTIDGNKEIHTEMLSDIGYERSVITIQALN